MNKSQYNLLIFLSGLHIVISLFQALIYFQLGPQLYTLDAFVNWFILTVVMFVVDSFLLLKYYRHKEYSFAFTVGIIAAIASFCFFIIAYNTITTRELAPYYTPGYILVLVTGMLHGVSMVFSKAGERPYLKIAGVFAVVVGLISLPLFILASREQDAYLRITYEKIILWTSLAESFIPLLLIKNFLDELKVAKKENLHIKAEDSVEGLIIFIKLIAVVATLLFGLMLGNESYSSLYWNKKNFEKTQDLAKLFEAHAFVNSKGDTLLYRLLKPLDYDSTKKYPLVVSLPYGGQPSTDKVRQIEGAAAAEVLSSNFNRKKYPAFIFIPHCPPGSGWGRRS
jgi:hypothetical protein